MTLSRLEKSHLIIHSCAVGAAFWSGAWGSIPVLGITPDTFGLVAICTTMGGLLAHNHGKRFDELRWMGTATAVAQYFAGALIIKGLSTMIPILGTAVNATVSLATVEAIGWAFHLILDEGRNPDTLSKRDIKAYLKRGEALRKTFAESKQFAWLDTMSLEDRKRYDELSKELASAKTTDERRAAVVAEIERLVAPYRPPET